MSEAIDVERMLCESAVHLDPHRVDLVRKRLFGRLTPITPTRYEIRKELGRGRFGRVYLAYDGHLRCNVALKVIHYKSEAERGRIEREAEALARIGHPNVIKVFDKGSVAPGTEQQMRNVMGQFSATEVRSGRKH